jgi:hypothetical protein
MNPLTTDQVLQLLGAKEIDIAALKLHIAALQARIRELEGKPDEG